MTTDVNDCIPLIREALILKLEWPSGVRGTTIVTELGHEGTCMNPCVYFEGGSIAAYALIGSLISKCVINRALNEAVRICTENCKSQKCIWACSSRRVRI